MRRLREANELTQKDIEKIWNFLAVFDRELSSGVRKCTDENVAIYEKWIDCIYGIRNIILDDK